MTIGSRFALVGGVVLASQGCGSGDECERPGIDCDVELAAPAVGTQFVVGPFDVAEGTEELKCFWRKVPFDMDVTEISVRYNLGSHHLDIFSVPYSMPDGEFDCSDPDEWGAWPSEVANGLPDDAPHPSIVVGFQNDTVDFSLPPDVSYKLEEGQQLMFQSHYANVSSQDVPTARALSLINLIASEDPTPVTAQTAFDEDFDIYLPARETTVLTRYCDFPRDVDLVSIFGHFHSRGVRHQVFTVDPDTHEEIELIYESTDWDEPPFLTWDTVWEGTIPARSVKMVAEYFNYEDRDIIWGNFVQENEHFETYLTFHPSVGLEANCLCYREGETPPACD
jgi:hypothetical protein